MASEALSFRAGGRVEHRDVTRDTGAATAGQLAAGQQRQSEDLTGQRRENA